MEIMIHFIFKVCRVNSQSGLHNSRKPKSKKRHRRCIVRYFCIHRGSYRRVHRADAFKDHLWSKAGVKIGGKHGAAGAGKN